MKFSNLLSIVGDQPIFETGLILTGNVDSTDVRRQLSRWVSAGKIRQLRRGLYDQVMITHASSSFPVV